MTTSNAAVCVEDLTYLIDLDGCIWLEGELLPGARAFVHYLKAQGHVVCYLTNTSSAPGSDLAVRLTHLGLPAAPQDVFTPLDALRHSDLKTKKLPVYVLGSQRLKDVLIQQGFDVTAEATSAGAVVLGRAAALRMAELEAAANVLWRGGILVALNQDARVPAQYGRILIGVGAVAACLEVATGVSCRLIGKPSPNFFLAALEQFGARAEGCVMVGDTLETDIVGARRLGIRTVWLSEEPEGDVADEQARDLEELLARMRARASVAWQQ